MKLPENKTKIVCTIGPASESPAIIEQMIRAGMNIARLNFSHGSFDSHSRIIENIRSAARSVGRRVAIMADLPGPKMRIGQLAQEPVELQTGDAFTLTTEEIQGDQERASISFAKLPQAVKPGNTLFLNDGFIQLEVENVKGSDVHCRVLVGGELRSRKGLNCPDIDLDISAFTDRDRECLEFALGQGVDAVSQSFVATEKDIIDVRKAAEALGHRPFIIAKLERSRARESLDAILETADGIMVARGDLGVEIPIERIAIAQKEIIRRVNLLGKPVITATQMLESMTGNRRPTRAESTDVANAIIDGTDCIMLSEESAMGKYPVDAVAMLANIAATVEPNRSRYSAFDEMKKRSHDDTHDLRDLISSSVEAVMEQISPAVVIAPSLSGISARSITRYRLPVWIVGVSSHEKTCQQLQFSYGVYPYHEPELPEDWNAFARKWLDLHGVKGDLVVLTAGPSSRNPNANHRMEIIDLRK
jgi:pyruvate kinase